MIIRQRVLARCVERPGPLATPCLVWTGSTNAGGYGQVRHSMGEHGDRRLVGAHIVMWESVNGPVPPGLELDHLCRVRPCVRCAICLRDNERLTYQYLRSVGYSPREARQLRGLAVHRRAAGVVDMRGA